MNVNLIVRLPNGWNYLVEIEPNNKDRWEVYTKLLGQRQRLGSILFFRGSYLPYYWDGLHISPVATILDYHYLTEAARVVAEYAIPIRTKEREFEAVD